jgi:hypothetical protein
MLLMLLLLCEDQQPGNVAESLQPATGTSTNAQILTTVDKTVRTGKSEQIDATVDRQVTRRSSGRAIVPPKHADMVFTDERSTLTFFDERDQSLYFCPDQDHVGHELNDADDADEDYEQ